MNAIRLLPDLVINQIAAGEVIERPASVVKELIENSLDAGARRILVDIRGGGIESISVSDDGVGIAREDLPFAVARHCTSKLARAEDLQEIATLGFRGEALASIAAVARLTVRSRAAGAAHAYELSLAGATRTPDPVPAAQGAGTTVEVTDLFFNTPSRRRFLRRPATEFLHILHLAKQIAFGRPGVHLQLVHDGRTVLAARAASDRGRVRGRAEVLLGRRFFKDALDIDAQAGECHIHGWLGTAAAARSQSDVQYLIVNGRVVRDRHLSHAIRLAFGERLPQGRYPCFGLALELPAAQVDVNVHPTKSEVRFRQTRQVHDAVFSVCRRALGGGASLRVDLPQTISEGARVADRRGVYRTLPGWTAPLVDPALRLVGKRWIVSLCGDRLSIVDGCAIVERLTLALLEKGTREQPLQHRPLIEPQPVGFANGAPAWLDELSGWGITLDAFGAGQYALRTLPVELVPVDVAALARAFGAIGAKAQSRPEAQRLLAAAVADCWAPAPIESGLLAVLRANDALAAPIAPAEFDGSWPARLVGEQ
jgi:DNA mismatch repair protein MutL